ncbi:FAD binding domain-containing protein [Lentzea atacamensis]|uniref:FAD binding domain-containing protein n=1 Tax=Lentzea atacamensis TaxID=531938 RepID=A0A316HLJ8_9PSEU|nr:FAD-dependent oxidoreductase [Lentzea atacamensis]PWK80923.1 FAD binding domain-containing protein [Lentzea atacamensis]
MQIFHPGDTGYDEERSGFQTGLRHEPQVIFAVESAKDVEEALRYAETHGLDHAVQATGHGLTTTTTGVLISTKRMNAVEVDAETRTARVEAGAIWQQVLEEAAPHGLAPLSGDASDVGVVGYTLGGGYSVLAREFGFASDRVRATETAGDVVTALEFELLPIDLVHAGELYFDVTHAEAVFEAFHKWELPDHVTASLTTIAFPAGFPGPLGGRSVVRVTCASTQPFDFDHLCVAPRLIEECGRKPFAAAAGKPLPPHTYQGDNVLLSDLPLDALHRVREKAANAEVPVFLGLMPLGGALTANATHLLKLISPQLGAEASHAEVFDEVRSFVVGSARNFRYAVG